MSSEVTPPPSSTPAMITGLAGRNWCSASATDANFLCEVEMSVWISVIIGAKTVAPCKPDVAQKHTGYMVGGTSPFGTRKRLPVYAERTIFDLPAIYINGGKRGFLVSLDPQVLRTLLPVREVAVAIPSR